MFDTSKPAVAAYMSDCPWFVPTPEQRARLNEITALTDRGYVGVSIIAAELDLDYGEAQDRLCEWVAGGYGQWVPGKEGIAASFQGDLFDSSIGLRQ